MKKVLFIAALTFSAFTFASETEPVKTKAEKTETEVSGGKVTVINDTDSKVSLHTGSGSVSLNPNGGKTSFSCDTGKKVKADGDVIFTNTSDFCGETVKLSDYL